MRTATKVRSKKRAGAASRTLSEKDLRFCAAPAEAAAPMAFSSLSEKDLINVAIGADLEALGVDGAAFDLVPKRANDSLPSSFYAELRQLHKWRRACIQLLQPGDRFVEAQFRNELGYSTHLPKEDRERLSALARKALKCIEKGEPVPPEAGAAVAHWGHFAELHYVGTMPYRLIKARMEKRMAEMVKAVPIYETFMQVRGLAAQNIATLVAETGDMGARFATPAKLWSWMGLGVNKGGKAERSCSKSRRVSCFIAADPLIKMNGEGRYRRVYDRRKEYELARLPAGKPARGTRLGWAHRRALRVMVKLLLRDMWREWRRQTLKESR